MTEHYKRILLFTLGVIFALLGLIGIFLPLLPTTPFMILSAACFAESSPRFHQMLLNNRWFGKELRDWEENKTMKRATKVKATWIILFTFSVSVLILWGKPVWQLTLILIAAILLFFLWRIAEEKS